MSFLNCETEISSFKHLPRFSVWRLGPQQEDRQLGTSLLCLKGAGHDTDWSWSSTLGWLGAARGGPRNQHFQVGAPNSSTFPLLGNVASKEWEKMASRAERLHEKRGDMVQVFKRPSSALNRAQASKHQKTVIWYKWQKMIVISFSWKMTALGNKGTVNSWGIEKDLSVCLTSNAVDKEGRKSPHNWPAC